MLRRMGSRRLLPVVQLALHLVLTGPNTVELYHAYRQSAVNTSSTFQLAAWQEGVPFRPTDIHPYVPVGMRAVILLNLPAALAAGAVIITLGLKGLEGDLAFMLAMAPCVALLWYAVGLWIDRRLGFLPLKARPFSRFRLRFWWLLYAASIVLLCLGVGGVLLLILAVLLPSLGIGHGGGTASLDVAVVSVTLLLSGWPLFAFIVCRTGLRRARAAPLT